jgi:predicted nucleotidyltransferase
MHVKRVSWPCNLARYGDMRAEGLELPSVVVCFRIAGYGSDPSGPAQHGPEKWAVSVQIATHFGPLFPAIALHLPPERLAAGPERVSERLAGTCKPLIVFAVSLQYPSVKSIGSAGTMATLLLKMHEDRARRREAERASAYRRLGEALHELLPPGSEVWVFGSLLKPGRFSEHSDIDIAVLHLPAGRSEAWLQSELGLRLERRVDVLNLNETGLRSKIERVGERWTL